MTFQAAVSFPVVVLLSTRNLCGQASGTLHVLPTTHRFSMRLFLTLLMGASFLAAAYAEKVSTTSESVDAPATGNLTGADVFTYREGSPEPMRLYVFKPDGWKPEDRRPVLMFFFGGGWSHGTPERAASWAKYAARLGMIGIAPDYRTRERFDTSPLASVADGRAALRWVQDHANQLGIDSSRIAVGGNSAGGHVALWTGISGTPPGSSADEAPRFKPRALILFSTVSDTSQLSGYTPYRFGEDATALSPLHQLDESMPPILAFHGDADQTVPVAQATALRDKLTAAGSVNELIVVPGGNHNFTGQLPEWAAKSRAILQQFLLKHGIL
jgi:acetyl esterase